MTDRLSNAIMLAANVHYGQTDKGGAPYILHPLRVMLAGKTEAERIVGVLHDTVEDSAAPSWTRRNLSEVCSPIEFTAIIALTRNNDESYADFIKRCGSLPLARRVKLNDLRDNLDTTRLPKPLTDDDWRRVVKYREAIAYLEGIDDE